MLFLQLAVSCWRLAIGKQQLAAKSQTLIAHNLKPNRQEYVEAVTVASHEFGIGLGADAYGTA